MTALLIFARRVAPALAALALLALTCAPPTCAAPESPAPEMQFPLGPGGPGFSDPLPADQAAPIVAAAQEVAATLGLPFGPDTEVKSFADPFGGADWWVTSGRWTYTHGGDRPVVVDPATGGLMRGARGPMRMQSSFTLRQDTLALGIAANYEVPRHGEEGPFLSEAEAIARATAALEAVGMPADVAFESAELRCYGGNPADSPYFCTSADRPSGTGTGPRPECTCGGAVWRLIWHYVYRGFRYERGLVVELDPRTGEVVAVVVGPRPRPPARAAVVAISEARAVAIAVAHLAARGWPAARPLTTARLEIAQPQLSLSGPPGQRGPKYDDPTCLLWTVYVFDDLDDQMRARGEEFPLGVGLVQIDAATGAVVGDAQAGGRLLQPASSAPAASRAPARRASAQLPLVLGGGVVAAWVLGSLFIRRRARPR